MTSLLHLSGYGSFIFGAIGVLLAMIVSGVCWTFWQKNRQVKKSQLRINLKRCPRRSTDLDICQAVIEQMQSQSEMTQVVTPPGVVQKVINGSARFALKAAEWQKLLAQGVSREVNQFINQISHEDGLRSILFFTGYQEFDRHSPDASGYLFSEGVLSSSLLMQRSVALKLNEVFEDIPENQRGPLHQVYDLCQVPDSSSSLAKTFADLTITFRNQEQESSYGADLYWQSRYFLTATAKVALIDAMVSRDLTEIQPASQWVDQFPAYLQAVLNSCNGYHRFDAQLLQQAANGMVDKMMTPHCTKTLVAA